MGSSSSSLNKSPFRTDSMVNPESPTKEDTLKKDDVSILPNLLQSSLSVKKSLESSRKSTSNPAVSPTTARNTITPVRSRWSFSSSKKSYGSKDETFFDSQQWLQSDSDDDFHSVNGDFTPSRGNTPKRSISDRPPRMHSLIFQEKNPSPLAPPQPRRKKLAELFRDSIREEREESGSSSAISTPYLSGTNSGEFINNVNAIEEYRAEEEKKKSSWHHHRCLPGFSSCGGSFVERKKKMSSENRVVAVK